MNADVIVLGGGIIGCALAEELARRRQRVVLLERDRLGTEASSAAAGILSSRLDLPKPDALFELCQAARALYPAWIRRLEQQSGLRVGYHRDGILYLVFTPREADTMAARIAWQQARGLDSERWTPAQVRRREPNIAGPIHEGFFFPLEGQVDNVMLMRALGLACRKARVTIREQVAAQRLWFRRQRLAGVETSAGRFAAPIVVNCLGSWAGFDERAAVPLPVQPVRGQMLSFQGPKGLFRHAVMSELGAYVVQRRDGQLLAGSTVEFVGFDKTLTFEGMHRILDGLRRFTKALDRCTFLEAWAGLRPCSADRLPILGATSIPGLYAATAHFRHGILLAPVTAVAMADLILTGRVAHNLGPFSPHRFTKSS